MIPPDRRGSFSGDDTIFLEDGREHDENDDELQAQPLLDSVRSELVLTVTKCSVRQCIHQRLSQHQIYRIHDISSYEPHIEIDTPVIRC